MDISDDPIENVVLLHGLHGSPTHVWTIKLAVQRKFPDAKIHVPHYLTTHISSTDELVQRVSKVLLTHVDKRTPIHVIGQSLGGVAAMNLYKDGWNVVKAITVGSPLHGASVLNTLHKVLPIVFNRGTYVYLRTKPCQDEPPHEYKTISMGILNSNFDSCVHRHEATLKEEHHTHETWLDHRFGFLHPRLLRTIVSKL